MVRRLIWVGLVAYAGWMALPIFGPRAVQLVSQHLDYPIQIESLQWIPQGLCATSVLLPHGRAERVDLVVGWDYGPSLQIRVDRAEVCLADTKERNPFPVLPAWLACEVALARSQFTLEGSDLHWNWEGSFHHESSRDRVWLSFSAGTSHVYADLTRLQRGGWSGQIDAEKVPLALLSCISNRLRHELLGELEISRGTASGHLEVDEGLSHGDILLENLAATESVLGLEIGIREGLLSLSGEDGIHLNVSEHGWISWGETGLEGLVGSILWKDHLELDLAGTVKGIDQKHVRVSTSQRPQGLVTRLELLRIPVRPAIAEITFLGPHHRQSRIELHHFGPEENGWLAHLLEPLIPLPAGSSWTAQNLDATALIEWREGRPCRIDLEDCCAADLCWEHPLLGEATLELVKGSLCIQPESQVVTGQLRAEGCSLERQHCRLFQQGSFSAFYDSAQGLSFDLAASIAGDPWTLSLQHGALLTLSTKGQADRFKKCFQTEEWPLNLLPEAWQGELAWDAKGLRLQGELQASGQNALLHVVTDHPLPSLQNLLEPSFWLQHPWKADLSHYKAAWVGSHGEAEVTLQMHLCWQDGQLEMQAWPHGGLVKLGPMQKQIARTEAPALTVSADLVQPDGFTGSFAQLLLPACWKARANVHLQFQEPNDGFRAELGWNQETGFLRASPLLSPHQGLELSWDLAQQMLLGTFAVAQQDPQQIRCSLLTNGPGSLALRTLEQYPGAQNAPYLELLVENWQPRHWKLRSMCSPQDLLGLFSPSEVTPKALTAGPPQTSLAGPWSGFIPDRMCVELDGGADRNTHLKVCADATETPGWAFEVAGADGRWEIEEGRLGPLQIAGKILASGRGLAIEQGQLAASSGEQVVVLSSGSPAEEGAVGRPAISLQLSKTGLGALLNDLAVLAGSQEQWARWLRLNQDLQATLIEDSERGWVLQIPLVEGKIRAVPLHCKEVEVWMAGSRLLASGTFCNRGRQDPFRVEMTQSSVGSGELLLEVAGEHCRCGWLFDQERGFCPLRVEGGLFGQVGHLTYAAGERSSLEGSLALDLRNLVPLVPDDVADAIEKLSLGKGVVFQGRVDFSDDISLEGKLVGNDVEAFGALWDKLSADVYCSPQVLCISGLHIEDPAGEIRAPRIELRELEPKNWQIDIPIAGARRLVMQRLRWPGSQKRSVKHLVIEEILLENILGPAERPQEWSGRGLISFENEAPRPALFFLPAELLGNLGLDLALLEPVRGRVHFAFEDGVIRLKDLEDVVSIKNRSRFFLHPDPGYAVIGFDGSVNIRIWMKQFVVLKITQPLNLYITGNLRDPEISFQHSDKRCALSTSSETASTCSSPPTAASAESL